MHDTQQQYIRQIVGSVVADAERTGGGKSLRKTHTHTISKCTDLCCGRRTTQQKRNKNTTRRLDNVRGTTAHTETIRTATPKPSMNATIKHRTLGCGWGAAPENGIVNKTK